MLLPLFLLISVFILVTGEGKVFFLQERVGKNGKNFKIIKFATMKENSFFLQGGGFTNRNDFRMMPFGNILRKYKINEIPQLFNVIFGHMSLVGYRPLTIESHEKMLNLGFNLHQVDKPGMTSVASLFFRDEEEFLLDIKDKHDYYYEIILPAKGSLDHWWYENKSLRNYFVIIILTITSVLFRSNKMTEVLLNNLPDKDYNAILKTKANK